MHFNGLSVSTMGMGDLVLVGVLIVTLWTHLYGSALFEAESLWVQTQLVALVFHWLTFLMKVVAADHRFGPDDVMMLMKVLNDLGDR